MLINEIFMAQKLFFIFKFLNNLNCVRVYLIIILESVFNIYNI